MRGLPLPQMLERNLRFVALDVETANGDAASICQIGLALVEASGAMETFSFFIDPEEDFAPFNTRLHGISAMTVAGCPNFPLVFEPLRPFLRRHPLVQHSTFDERAIAAACKAYGLAAPDLRWHNSVQAARTAWPELRGNGGHGLGSLKTHLGLEFQHHDAAEDAKAAAQVVLLAEKKTGADFFDGSFSRVRVKPGAAPAPAKRGGGLFPKSVAREGNPQGRLYGHAACFSGDLTISREEAARMAAEAGVTVKASVSRKVTMLVVGRYAMSGGADGYLSTKHRRAVELKEQGHEIRVISEEEFLAVLRGE
jgi:DNA polymerase-3 subunit epsilon